MNENGSFLDWLKLRWKMINVSDTRFFRFIWIVAISITLITVIISAGVTAAKNKKEKAAEEQRISEEQASSEEAELLATFTDATATDASVDVDAWMTILVNADNPIPDNFEIHDFTELRNGQKVDSRIYPELQRMFDDMRAEGHSPYITSSYRTREEQQEVYDEKVTEIVNEGKTEEQAKAEALSQVALPGTSEHETGLAIDVGSDAGEEAQNSLWTWITENSYKYGYIVRYPEDKTDITGISYEPWHLRYVGVDAANMMHENGWCLEEYLMYK